MISMVNMGDLGGVGELAGEFAVETGITASFDLHAFVKVWSSLLDSGTGGLWWRLDDNGSPCEAMGAIIYPDPYDGKLVSTLMFWYVRGKNTMGPKMFAAFEEWSDAHGASRRIVSALLAYRFDVMRQFLDRCGYSPVEVHFMKEGG